MKLDRTEGDINISINRNHWIENNIDSETKKLLEDDSIYFLHQSLSTPCLNVLDDCEGSYLIDKQGRKYLDFHGNNVHHLGYKNEVLISALLEQLKKLSFSPRRYTNEQAIGLAKRLVNLSGGLFKKVLLAPGGTSAMSMALKLARIVTGKFKTISWWDSFHGASMDSISVGGEALFRKKIGPLMPGAIHIPPPSTYRGQINNYTDVMASADYLDYVMEHETDIAAFIAEPIRYTTGVIPPPEYWNRVREICDKHNTLLIFDEIPTCLGRTGKFFTYQNYDISPDIICIGKGLAGGLIPMAGILTREEFDIAGDISIGHFTHEKNPLGSAVANALIDYMQNENMLELINHKGEYFFNRLTEMKNKYELIGDVRYKGLLFAVELVKNRDTKEPANDAAEKIMYLSLERGLSFKISSGNILSLMPPLTISQEEIDESLNILNSCFESLA